MEKRLESGGLTMVIKDSFRGKALRRVFIHLPYIAPPGADWKPGHEGRHIELTSSQGGPVALYCFYPKLGKFVFEGSLRDYAPGESLREAFKEAWLSEQPSAAALKSVEDSFKERWS